MPNIVTPGWLVAKVPGDTVTQADPNTLLANVQQVHANMRAVIAAGGSDTYNDTINSIEARVAALEISVDYMAYLTDQAGGFWANIVWKDTDEICIKCKGADGITPFIGARLNDNTFLYLTADYTVKYDTPGNAGHIIDDITAKLNNEWFIIWAYEAAGGALAFGITWMPNYTLHSEAGDNALTLHQINAQDACKLVPVGAHLMLFEDDNEWESPLANQDGAAVTYDATKDKPKVASTSTTVVTLAAVLTKTDFAHGTYVYQVDNFQPLQIADGAIAAEIGARGYKDTGFRFLSTAAGAVQNFVISGDYYLFSNGTGAADIIYNTNIGGFEPTAAFVNYLCTYVPPDKCGILWGYVGTEWYIFKRYYETYGEVLVGTTAGSQAGWFIGVECKILHKLLSVHDAASYGTQLGFRGYKL